MYFICERLKWEMFNIEDGTKMFLLGNNFGNFFSSIQLEHKNAIARHLTKQRIQFLMQGFPTYLIFYSSNCLCISCSEIFLIWKIVFSRLNCSWFRTLWNCKSFGTPSHISYGSQFWILTSTCGPRIVQSFCLYSFAFAIENRPFSGIFSLIYYNFSLFIWVDFLKYFLEYR